MMRQTNNIIISCISLALLLTYIISLSLIDTNRKNPNTMQVDRGVWNLHPLVLSVLAGEFKGMMADLLILEAGSRVGTRLERVAKGEFIAVPSSYTNQTIFEILAASQSLDPSFQQTFMLAQGWLPWDDGLVEETIGILQTAQENRPWDFFPTQFMAFDTYYFLNNYTQAGEILLKAAARENAPPYFGILGARLSHKGGDTKAAIILMRTAVEGKEAGEPGYQKLQDRLKALEGTFIIEQAVARYQDSFFTFPEQPEQLLLNSILPSLPENPYNVPYCINRHGKVFFDRPHCRKKPE